MSYEVWKAQVASLQSDYRCIVPDLRGFGRSENNEGSLSFDLLASDIAALVAALNLPSAHIVGASLGAMIAMTFAATYPEFTRSVAIMHSEALPDDDEAILAFQLAAPQFKLLTNVWGFRRIPGGDIDKVVRCLQGLLDRLF